jgi:hypothetical protein
MEVDISIYQLWNGGTFRLAISTNQVDHIASGSSPNSRSLAAKRCDRSASSSARSFLDWPAMFPHLPVASLDWPVDSPY